MSQTALSLDPPGLTRPGGPLPPGLEMSEHEKAPGREAGRFFGYQPNRRPVSVKV